MTSSESQRHIEQRRIADVVDQYEQARMSARVQMLGIMIVASTFFGSIILFIASSSMAPVSERVTKVETKVENLEGKIDRILNILEKK